jgi:hypothetical protein
MLRGAACAINAAENQTTLHTKKQAQQLELPDLLRALMISFQSG